MVSCPESSASRFNRIVAAILGNAGPIGKEKTKDVQPGVRSAAAR